MKLIDLTGQKFGRLLVLERDYEYQKKHNYIKPYWKCRCNCGKIVTVMGKSLREGKTKSCGCFNKDTTKKLNFVDITNQKFGLLTPLKYLDNSKWLCKCNCGNETIVTTSHLKSGHTISCGCLRSKGENKIGQLLLEKSINFKKEYTNENLRNSNGNKVRVDFAILNKQNQPYIFIEYNGKQHFDEKDKWYKESIIDGTKAKEEFAKEKNIKMIHINYNDDIEFIFNNIDFSEITE